LHFDGQTESIILSDTDIRLDNLRWTPKSRPECRPINVKPDSELAIVISVRNLDQGKF
jgi:hypothetical protein